MVRVGELKFRLPCLVAFLVLALVTPAFAAPLHAQADRTVSAAALYQQGMELVAADGEQNRDTAIALFHRAIGAHHDFAQAYTALSNAYRLKAPWDGGDRTWIDRAIAFGEKAVFLSPGDPTARVALGQAYLAKRWYRQALPHFSRAYELDPSPEHAMMVAWMGIEMGDYEAVVRKAERAQSLVDSPDLDVSFYLAWAWRVLGDYGRSEPLIREVLSQYPDLRCGNSLLLFDHLVSGRAAQAIAHADALVARNPGNPVLLSTAGLAYWYAGQDSVARRHFEGAIASSPPGERVIAGCWGTYVQTALGDILWRAGERERARELFAHSAEGYQARLKEAGEGWGYHYDLARTYAVMGMRDEAYHRLRDAIRFGWSEIALARLDPMLANLRGEVEFDRLMASVAQRLEEQRKRLAASPN